MILLVLCAVFICISSTDAVKDALLYVAAAEDRFPGNASLCSTDLNSGADLECNLRSAWQYCSNIAPRKCRIEILNPIRFIPDLGELVLLPNMHVELAHHNPAVHEPRLITPPLRGVNFAKFIKYHAPDSTLAPVPSLLLEHISISSFADRGNLSTSFLDIDGDIQLTLDHCMFFQTYSKRTISLQNTGRRGGFVDIRDCSFFNGRSLDSAIFAQNVNNLTISYTTFNMLESSSSGGGLSINASNSAVVLQDLTFGRSNAKDYGGAIFIGTNNSNILLNRIVMDDCKASKGEGALFIGHGNQDVRMTSLTVTYPIPKEGGDMSYGGD